MSIEVAVQNEERITMSEGPIIYDVRSCPSFEGVVQIFVNPRYSRLVDVGAKDHYREKGIVGLARRIMTAFL
jgi:hypothetical protein